MITAYFDEIRQTLILDEAVASFTVIREISGNNDGFIRVKCQLADGSVLEFAEYFQIVSCRISCKTYNNHWQTCKGHLIKRWDNAPHHCELASFPDHLHDGGKVIKSKPMTLSKVLLAIKLKK